MRTICFWVSICRVTLDCEQNKVNNNLSHDKLGIYHISTGLKAGCSRLCKEFGWTRAGGGIANHQLRF
jgi:hypothetical protein